MHKSSPSSSPSYYNNISSPTGNISSPTESISLSNFTEQRSGSEPSPTSTTSKTTTTFKEALKANIREKEKNGYTPEKDVLLPPKLFSLLALLSNPIRAEKNGNTAFHRFLTDIEGNDNAIKIAIMAVEKNNQKEQLVKALNTQNNDGNTPLHIALTFGLPFPVISLLITDLNIQKANQQGQTPLIVATQNVNPIEVIKALIERNPNVINAQDTQGKTALHHAAERGEDGIVKLLIDSKAKVGIKDKGEKTPLGLAREVQGNGKVVEILEKISSN